MFEQGIEGEEMAIDKPESGEVKWVRNKPDIYIIFQDKPVYKRKQKRGSRRVDRRD